MPFGHSLAARSHILSECPLDFVGVRSHGHLLLAFQEDALQAQLACCQQLLPQSTCRRLMGDFEYMCMGSTAGHDDFFPVSTTFVKRDLVLPAIF